MTISIVNLIDGAEGTMIGEPLPLDKNIWKGGGSLPILISGITDATVSLEATLATQQEVDEGTALWETVSSASWTADVADGLFTPFSHIRGRVVAWVSGEIYMKTAV